MKIAFALYDYYPFGGLQDDCLKTALASATMGHEVHIFTRTWKGDRPDALHVHTLGKSGWTNTARNERFFEQLESGLAPHSFDGVVAFNRIPGADIYFAADPCYAVRSSDWSWLRKLHPRHRYYLALERKVLGATKTPHTLVLTKSEIEAFRTFYPVERSKFHLLPPGVTQVEHDANSAAENQQVIRQELGCASDAVVALFVGSGFRIKGLDRALRAIAANRNATRKLEFWIVGNGKQSRYASLAKQAGVTVRFLGGRADVDRFYEAADFLLHPAYSESAGKVLLEALTHGLPVLTTDTCGYAPHIARAEAGAVIPSPFSQKALNQTVQEFIQDADKRQVMQKNALAYAASEDLYSCHQAAANIIEDILLRKNS